MSATYSFLPWVRQGAVAAVGTPDTLSAGLSTRAGLPVRLRLDATAEPVEVPIQLRGPGDVIGIDPRQIVRTEPRPGTSDFPPSYFTAVEFDSPDFPWLFTPARAETQQGRLRPWLTLVVVRRQEGVTLGGGAGPLPVLDIRSPAVAADELPDLAEAWAWAHAQVLHEGGAGDIDTALAGRPERTVARLLAPRRLTPRAQYIACIVPTFDIGRKVGLGMPVTAGDEAELRLAWGSGADAPSAIQLPLYHYWFFGTGAAGDFEGAVRRLRPLGQLPATVGGTRLHVGDAGTPALPDLGTVDYAGVFRPPAFEPPLLPPSGSMTAAQTAWVHQVTEWLNLADDAASGATEEALVTFPLYGRFHQALQRVPTADGWMRDLNLDARNRAAAGLGTLFIQHHQEDLMASAWEQLGDLQQARQIVRQSQFALEVGDAAFAKRVEPMMGRGEMLYQSTSPVHARVAAQGDQTIEAWADAQRRPRPGTLATFRRLSRPGGPIARRMRGSVVDRLAAPIGIRPVQTGAANPLALQNYVAQASTRVAELQAVRVLWNGGVSSPPAGIVAAATIAAATSGGPVFDPEAAARAVVALDITIGELTRMMALTPPAEPAMQPFSMPMQASLLQQLRPSVTVPSQLRSRLRLDPTVSPAPAETEILGYPQFPQPMYEAVRELMPELLLAGAGDLPENTVTLLETNPQFIEAFMVGLNHEMARELLWRGFPTDLRGSYFRYFWGDTGEANLEREPDVPPLHEWSAASRLGGNLADGHVAGQLVLVIKGDLLRRFPGTVIYAVRATAGGGLSTTERYPLHRGVAGDGAVFLLFDLTAEEARGGPAPAGDGGPGWFFVLQEQPTEPRFGLDAAAVVPTPTRFSDLAWEHVATTPGGYLQVAASAPAFGGIDEPGGPGWGFNGAHMADIALQRPFRVAIPARKLV